jgi:hypothetical protein
MKLRFALSFFLGCAVAALFALVFAHWYLGGSTRVKIENQSGQLLESVSISGNGFKASFAEIGPNSLVRARVYPTGESGQIDVAFRSNGRDFNIPVGGYFEGGGAYDLRVTIDHNFKVALDIDAYSRSSILWP